jgi:multidrug efflux pump subunit AcrB
VNSSLELQNPEIQVHILRDRAAFLRVSPEQIETALNSAFGGREISTIYGVSDQYLVFVQLEAHQPLGIAVVGGLLFSQLLTLYLTPTFYVSLERFTQWLRRGPARYAQRA